MTANTTPRLGLMDPTDSDNFVTADFANTMTTLDSVPGTKIVANYTALTALSWGIPQHGSRVLQADTGAEWFWYNPSGSGTWKRLNSVGLLARVSQNADVSTAATSSNGILVVQTGNITIPGGRYLELVATLGLDGTSGQACLAQVTCTDNGSVFKQFVFRPGLHFSSLGNSCVFTQIIAPPSANTVHNYAIYVRSLAGSTASGAGGTTSARTSVMSIVEI